MAANHFCAIDKPRRRRRARHNLPCDVKYGSHACIRHASEASRRRSHGQAYSPCGGVSTCGREFDFDASSFFGAGALACDVGGGGGGKKTTRAKKNPATAASAANPSFASKYRGVSRKPHTRRWYAS